MNSINHAPTQTSAIDALFDQIEQDLLELTTAPLDGRAAAPRQCVDEFADDFLCHWSMPPRRVQPGRQPG